MEDHSTHGSPPSSQRLKSNLITDTGTFQLSLQLIMENHSTYVSSPSQKLESYEITDIVIGRGSYGVVYEAIEKTTGQKFAVKVTKKINLNPEDLIRNQTEAENLKLLHHSNILKFHDFIEDSSRFYLFTEIVNGGELFDRIVENDGFSEIEAKAIIHKILLAVDHCHKNGIVHRDIKAENILLVNENDNDTDFDLRLIDFGFAVKADGTSLFGELGTPDYMAPELWGGTQHYGAPVDMWALGVLVYIVLVSYPPFLGRTSMDIKRKIIHGIYEFDPEYWGDISEEAIDFVKRLLTVDMNKRMTAEVSLLHPWLAQHDSNATATDLSSSIVLDVAKDRSLVYTESEDHQNNKNQPAKRRVRSSFNPIMAINRMKRLYSLRRDGLTREMCVKVSTYGYLTSLSCDTDICSNSSCSLDGYDSDITGQRSCGGRTPSIPSTEQCSRDAHGALWTDNFTPIEKSLIKKAVKTIEAAQEKISFSNDTDTASSFVHDSDTGNSSVTTETNDTFDLSGMSSDDENYFDTTQIEIELNKDDEDD